jgi:alpha-L-rhamnosidase
MFSVQSDCPHRERFGYGGDMVAASGMALYNLDMAQFYAKAVRDFADGQRPNGGFPEIAPDPGSPSRGWAAGRGRWGGGPRTRTSPGSSTATTATAPARGAVPERAPLGGLPRRGPGAGDTLYQDISDHESSHAPAGRAHGHGVLRCSTRARRGDGSRLGRRGRGGGVRQRAARIARTINARFLDPRTGRYALGTQAAQAFALALVSCRRAPARALQVLVGGRGRKSRGT